MAHLKHRVVLCGSMSAYAEMLKIAGDLEGRGISTIVPVPEDHIKHQLSYDEFQAFKREVSFRHLKHIRNPATYAVLAVNVDKHGIRSYVGPNTFAEIAVAFAQRKAIYLYQGIPATYEDELMAWGAVPVNGDFDRLVFAFERYRIGATAQLPLFDD
jgi:hypothetical protein